METTQRWIVAIVAVAAIVALILFARGATERGQPDSSPTATVAGLSA
jgi:hypothetical protein